MDYVRSVAVSCVAAAFLICDQRRSLEDRPLRCTTYVNSAPTVPMYPYVPSTYVVYRHMAIHVYVHTRSTSGAAGIQRVGRLLLQHMSILRT